VGALLLKGNDDILSLLLGSDVIWTNVVDFRLLDDPAFGVQNLIG
jgi:hypothetical protein